MQTATAAGLIPINAVFIWDNLVDLAALLTPSSEVATLLAANLQTGQRTKVWRTTGCAEESLRVQLGAHATIRCIALINHNLSTAAQVRIEINTQDLFEGDYGEGGYGEDGYGGGVPYDETINMTEPGTGFGVGGFGSGGFGGGPGVTGTYLSSRQIAPPWVYFLGLDDGGLLPAGSYAKITFYDPYNPDGYLQFGRIYISDYLESSKNYLYGLRSKLVDPSEATLSDGGIDWRNRKDPYMTIGLDIKNISDIEAARDFITMFYEVQTTQNFIFMRRPGTAVGRTYYSHYGCFTGEMPIIEDFHDQNSIELQFKEVR